MDTFEWTKIGGALCGALLIFLLLNWGTEIIYHSHDDYYGEEKLAYYLEVEVSDVSVSRVISLRMERTE